MSAQIALHQARHEAITDTIGNGQWLQPLRNAWPDEVLRCLADHAAVVRVMLVDKQGSAPRNAGTCMLVMPTILVGTIGGGHLEWEAIRSARAMLDTTPSAIATETPSRTLQVRRMVLGQELSQCCGGVVQLWLERFTRDDLSWLRLLSNHARDPDAPLLSTQFVTNEIKRQLLRPGMPQYPRNNLQSGVRLTSHGDEHTLIERLNTRRMTLWLYGAGHVGQALVRLLAELPIDITWIDSRAELLPTDLPRNVRIKTSFAPLEVARSAPAGAHHRVLTHDHGLDYALCRELLDSDFASLGVIGSRSKAAKFRAQLKRDGVAPERVAELLCPIGITMTSKEPVAIAIGIAAQLLQLQADASHAMKPAEREVMKMTGNAGDIHTDSCNGRSCETCLDRATP